MSPATAEPRSARVSSGRDYGYANARIRAMRSRLLELPFFEELMSGSTIKDLIGCLSATEYAPYLDEALIQGVSSAHVDEALRNNMVGTYRKVLSFLNDEAQYIVSTLLGRWDVFNIKTLLRAKHLEISSTDLLAGVLPVGALGPYDIEALAQQDGVKALVDTIVTWGLPFAAPLREGYPNYLETGELIGLELAMDQFYATWAMKRLAKKKVNVEIGKRILGIQMDVSNLLMTLRLLQADVELSLAQSYFLPGGLVIDRELYEDLAGMSDVDEILEGLKKTVYGRVLSDVVLFYLEQNSISVFERALENHLIRHVMGLGKEDLLGVGVVISFLWAKQNEVTNIRIIVKGKSVGMPLERVRKELILV